MTSPAKWGGSLPHSTPLTWSNHHLRLLHLRAGLLHRKPGRMGVNPALNTPLLCLSRTPYRFFLWKLFSEGWCRPRDGRDGRDVSLAFTQVTPDDLILRGNSVLLTFGSCIWPMWSLCCVADICGLSSQKTARLATPWGWWECHMLCWSLADGWPYCSGFLLVKFDFWFFCFLQLFLSFFWSIFII